MKKKREKPQARNPVAPHLRDPKFRKKIAKSDDERAEQRDPWSKRAKHKKAQSLEEFYQVGDKVDIVSGPLKKVLDRAEKLRKKDTKAEKKYHTKDGEAIVRVADGPMGALGITIDGEYHLVDPEDVKLLYETFQFDDLMEWSYVETSSGISVPVSQEENEVLKMCSNKLYKRNLDDREQEVARRMVSRGVLHRGRDDEGVFFTGGAKKLKRF